MKYEKNSPIAQQNAKAVEEFLLAEQAKGKDCCSRMEIEIACGLLHNQWDKAKERLGDRLVGFGSVPKLFKYRIAEIRCNPRIPPMPEKQHHDQRAMERQT